MKNRLLHKELERIVGRQHVAAGLTDTEVYSYDGSLVFGRPECVVFPADAAQVAAVVRATRAAGVPCIPRGFGTNLSGGSIAPRGGVILCLVRLNRILAIQPDRRVAVAQAGVTNLELQDALAPLGFFYAPDPASQKAATLGGNVGENAGGPHCVKYGVTTNHILGMEVVLPDGDVLRIGGPALDPPGLDLRGILVGGEGTLGVVTEVTVRILPKPESVVTFLAIYDSVADAARSVSAIIAHGIVPATLEMMDALVMRAVEESFPTGLPLDAAAVLIIEVEGPAAGLAAQVQSIRDLCAAHGCRTIRQARDAAERDQLWAGRRGAFGALARIAPNFLVNDCTVPRNRLPEALERAAAIARKHGFKIGNVFHAGDGNLHPNLFFDGRDPDQMRRVHEAGLEIMRACVALGGTITGEHGVGVEKREALRLVFSEDDLDFQRTLRRVFDPLDLFNPGKVLPDPAEGRGSRGEGRGKEPEPPPSAVFSDRAARITRHASAPLVPAEPTEASEMVRRAAADGIALLPTGGGRRADFGNLSERELIPLRSETLTGVVEHDADNQTVTFAAGTTLRAAQEHLVPHRQWLPFRPPLADGCTLGGMVALGACGPERLAHGAPRDRLLGLRFVSGEGRLITAGGRVVKNVAGYDVTRLLAGSAGTLGFLTDLTFRVAAVPEVCRVLRAGGSLVACASAASAVLRSNLEPVFVTASPSADAPWELQVGFEGFEETLRAQLVACSALLTQAGLSQPRRSDYPLLEGIHAERLSQLTEAPFLLRADLPLDAVAPFAADACLLPAPSTLDPRPSTLLLDFGCGRILAGLPALADDAWDRLGSLADAAGGHVLLETAPAEFKRTHDVFGRPRADWPLLHRLKDALDPHGIFAPGRLPGRK